MNSTKPKHSPLPWHRNIQPATKYPTFWSGRNTHVGYVAGPTYGTDSETAEANLEFLVRACNSHYELVEALEAVKAWMDDLDILELEDGKLTNLVYTALERAKGETEVTK